MRHLSSRLAAASFVLLWLGASGARAEFLNWTAGWSRSPVSIPADGGSSGSINLTLPQPEIGAPTIPAVFLTVTPPSGNVTDTFTNEPYSLTVTFTDNQFNASGSLTFKGTLSGSSTATLAHITNVFSNPTTQTLQLGNHLYTVTIGPYVPPPENPNSTISGSISAQVVVSDITGGGQTPEPSGLVLMGLALPPLGLAGWRRWTTRPRLPSA